MDELAEIKKYHRQGKLALGAKLALKKLRANKAEKVWLSSSASEEAKKEIGRYCRIGNVPLAALSIPGDELGLLCKKQYPVSVVSLAKGEQ
ncbi:hypothetical protein GF323_00265 [Candidatus Woesearchaeota archaeon]|nr:hypothetical protein [Candidatus Woesearchaeota archaeon]